MVIVYHRFALESITRVSLHNNSYNVILYACLQAAFVNVQEANSSDSDMLAHSEQSVPKETTTTRMVKVLRRVQILQDKLKNGHFLQGSGDHQT